MLTSPKKDADGKPILGPDGKPELLRATAKFIAIPDTSDEMLRANADHDFMAGSRRRPAARRCGSKTCRRFLKELKAEPLASDEAEAALLPRLAAEPLEGVPAAVAGGVHAAARHRVGPAAAVGNGVGPTQK